MERCSAPREVVRNAERLLRDDRTLLEGVGRLLRGRASTEEPREQINVQLVAAFGRYVGDAARPTLARACGYYIPKPTTHPPFLRRWLSPPRVGRAGSTKTTTSLWESRERRKPPKSRSDVSPHRRYNAPLRHNGVTCCALASTPLMSAYGILRPADGVRTCALSRARSLARALSVSALADRKLCLQYHPDKSPCTTELFQIIAQAKEVLTDQIARTHYDWSCDWFDPARSSCTGGRSAAAAAAAAETGAAEARAAEAGAAATAWYRRPCCHRTRRPAPQASARTARSSARASARASARPSPSAPGSARPSNSDNDDMPDLISGSDDDSDDESGDDSDGDSDDAVNPEQQGRDGRLPGWIPTWRRQKCDAVNHTFPGAWWRHCGATKHVRRRAAARRWSGASRAAAAEAHAQRKEGSLGDPCAAAGGDDAAAGGSPESAEEAAGHSAGDDADPSADIHADPCADVDTASSADMRACCPRTNVDTDPNADTFAYPRAVVDADSCAGVDTDPSADIRAYSCAVVDADPSADVDAAVRAVVDADPCANVDTDPITEVDDPSAGVDTDSSAKFDTDLSADIRAYPRAVVGADPSTEVDDPGAGVDTDSSAKFDTELSADIRAYPRAVVGADPSTEVDDPGAGVDTDPSAKYDIDPSADIRAYPRAVVGADPSAEFEIDPSADSRAYSRTVVGADPCADVDTDPSADVDAGSCADVDTDPSADIRAYFRADVDTIPSTEVDDPSAGVDTDSSAKFDIDPSADIRACPRAVVGADPSAEFEIDPSADSRAYSRTVVGADPCADVDTDPSADVDAGSCADVDTDPSADIRAYFRADVDTIPSTEVDDPSAGVDTDSSADVEIDPSADVRAYPRTVVGADPCADVDTDPGADIDADSCADVDIDPSSDIRAYPRAGIDTNSSTDGGLANSSANDEHKAIARSELAAARNVLAARSLTVVVLVAIVAQPEVVAKLLCIIGVVLAALACDNGGAALPSPTHDCLRGGGPVSGDNGDEETDEIHKPSIWCNHDCLRGGGTPTAADSAYDAVEDLPGDELEQYRWLAGQSFRIVRGGVPSGTRYVVTHLERCAYKDGTYENVAYFLDPQVELLPCNASDASVSATEAASGTKKGVPGDSHCTVAEAIEFVRLTKLQEGAAYNEANFTRYSRSGHTRPIDRRYWEVPLVDCKGGSCAFGWPVR